MFRSADACFSAWFSIYYRFEIYSFDGLLYVQHKNSVRDRLENVKLGCGSVATLVNAPNDSFARFPSAGDLVFGFGSFNLGFSFSCARIENAIILFIYFCIT